MNTLLIIDSEAPAYCTEITKRNLSNLSIRLAGSVDQGQKYAPGAHIIFGQPDLIAPILTYAKNLLWVQSTFAGIEPLCAAGLRNDYLLTGVKNVFGPLMSEYIFAYILAQERQLFTTQHNQRSRKWQPTPHQGLNGLTIGIAGLGSIGRHLAQTAAHFRMRVLGLKRTPGKVAYVDQVFLPCERSDFLPQLDYLVLTLPDTPETKRFIRLEELKMMKKTSTLMNVGRGINVDQDSLVTALRRKYIMGAVLDVFEQEPLSPDSPLWGLPNVHITPHISAFSFPGQIASIFCENYQRFLEGKPLRYIVDFERGY